MEDNCKIPGSLWAFIAPAVGTVVAAWTCSKPIIACVECAAIVREGGRIYKHLDDAVDAFIFIVELAEEIQLPFNSQRKIDRTATFRVLPLLEARNRKMMTSSDNEQFDTIERIVNAILSFATAYADVGLVWGFAMAPITPVAASLTPQLRITIARHIRSIRRAYEHAATHRQRKRLRRALVREETVGSKVAVDWPSIYTFLELLFEAIDELGDDRACMTKHNLTRSFLLDAMLDPISLREQQLNSAMFGGCGDLSRGVCKLLVRLCSKKGRIGVDSIPVESSKESLIFSISKFDKLRVSLLRLLVSMEKASSIFDLLTSTKENREFLNASAVYVQCHFNMLHRVKSNHVWHHHCVFAKEWKELQVIDSLDNGIRRLKGAQSVPSVAFETLFHLDTLPRDLPVSTAIELLTQAAQDERECEREHDGRPNMSGREAKIKERWFKDKGRRY